jgi:hypothetical protein
MFVEGLKVKTSVTFSLKEDETALLVQLLLPHYLES